MRIGAIVAVVIAAIVAIGAFYMIDVDQTEEGSLPEVEVTGGNMPEFDADVGSVDVGTTEETVSVPDVDVEVSTEEKTISVPDIDINPPADN